ncbi:MAG: hypothetical protein EXR95_11075 [Gemmatimonadetes bacterium]|nr:hypothetical protein [Gemmatimonadota bacterium]
MSGDGVRDGQETSRRIREEIERIHEAEGRVEEALETVRQARRRVEVVARELSREEERVRAWVREEQLASGSPAGARSPEASAPETAARTWRSEPPAGWAVGRDAAARDVAATTPAATPRPTEAMPGDRARRPAVPEADAWAVQPVDAGATAAAPAPLLRPTVVLPHDRSGWGRRAGLGVAALLASPSWAG